ncbi:MAG: hemolysin D, partial [Planctomycetia bacterium]|nr:hemolysin D [Planctomycetia bacterium]
MATLADSLVSSSSRRLNIRVRPDLSARRQRYQGRSCWVVKDPVGLQYYRFQDEEYFILNLLDGDISLDEIRERFEAEFPPQKITLDEIQNFLGMLHQSSLILVQVQGQGEQLLRRRSKKRRRELIGAWSNILAVRFKGVDPERMLNALSPWTQWIFSWPMLVLATILASGALLLISVQWAEFQAKLPGFYQFFSPTNGLLLAVILGLTKICHEFGHGLACKRFGGECHEMGVMFLVLTPCLYCNVSDSWMLPNKWHRMAIDAAGMYVEVILASICTFLWWFSGPGLFQNLCLNLMFVSGVSTILFNANPLLRYDGYYILADYVEIPNLRQKSSQVLGRESSRVFLGLEPPEDPFLPQRNKIFFALYTVAATAYRWVITFSILWFLYHLFKPYKLEIIAIMIGAMSLFSLLVMPLWKIGKFLYTPGRLDRVKKLNLYLTLAGAAVLVYLFCFVPIPMTIMAPFEIQPRDPASVYVRTPGRLSECNVR